MQDSYSRGDLKALHHDLIALSQQQLRNVDRLWLELESRIQDFKQILDERRRNEASRKRVLSGEVQLDEETFSLNKEFQEATIQLADTLDLDEVESVKLLLSAQNEVDMLDRPISTSAIILFYQRKHFLLECFRLILTVAVESDIDETYRSTCREIITLVLSGGDQPGAEGPPFILQCLRAMFVVEERLLNLTQREQGAIALGQLGLQERDELHVFEEQTLTNQHESLCGIITLMVKANYCGPENFETTLERVSKLDRWTGLTVHYCPIILSFIAQYGSPEGVGSLTEARALNEKIMDRKDSSMWSLRYLQAAVQTWWLAEYSGWYSEQPTDLPLADIDLDQEARVRSEAFFQALKEGAFQCSLTICAQITQPGTYDSSRSSLVSFLLRDSPLPQRERLYVSSWFQLFISELLESFIDSLITNMPDTLRQFKSDEDEQRKRIYSKLQKPGAGGSLEQDMHLERFLVIASFSFTDRGDAAHCFWGDTESNLHGFLQWASRRQSTPCVSAFCELLRAISNGEEFAACAHRFLLEENAGAHSKLRRRGSLSWVQILDELATFTSRVRDGPKGRTSRKLYDGKPDADDIMEPESVLMLENYLRLMAHLCTESRQAREWALSLSNPQILDLILGFCTSSIPGRLQACALRAVASLVTAKTPEISTSVWSSLDLWAFGYHSSTNISRPTKVGSPSAWFEEVTTSNVLASFDQLEQFTNLLSSLLSPFNADDIHDDILPFPENLGSLYRMGGVRPYIDLVMKAVHDGKVGHSDDLLSSQAVSNAILRFIVVSLGTFDESKVVLASKASSRQASDGGVQGISSYLRMHPFSRIMEWLFDDLVVSWLFAVSRADVDRIMKDDPKSIQMQCIAYGVEVMNFVFDLQSTFFNIVRPLLKDHTFDQASVISKISLIPFEEKLLQHPQIVRDIGVYAGLGDLGLSTASLAFLTKLGSSRRLRAKSHSQNNLALAPNSLINILQKDDYVESISLPLIAALEGFHQEITMSSDDPSFVIKHSILEFLLQTLISSPGKPTIAHAFLGFRCAASGIDISPEGLFAREISLFHAVALLATAYPDVPGYRLELGAIRLRRMATEVLSLLWTSSLSSAFVIPELLQIDFLSGIMGRQRLSAMPNAWHEIDTMQLEFLMNDSAKAIQESLHLRRLLFEYAMTVIRFASREGTTSTQAQILSALHGAITVDDGQKVLCPSVVDLSDFLDLALPASLDRPPLQALAEFNVEVFREERADPSQPCYQANLVELSLEMQLQKYRKSAKLQDTSIEQQVFAECAHVAAYVHSQNNLSELVTASQKTLESWCNLIVLTADATASNDMDFQSFTRRIQQILLPKMEVFAFEQDPRAIHIAKLLRHLTTSFPTKSKQGDGKSVEEVIHDQGFQVFRAALRSSAAPEINSDMRETLNQICYTFLVQTTVPGMTMLKSQQILHALKTVGSRYLESLCNEVLEAEGSARITAILLLDAYCTIGSMTETPLIVDALVKTNFLQVLVEGIERIPEELREAGVQDISALLAFYEAKFSLLLTIAQSRSGASHIVNAGLFPAVSGSGLFSVDPDIGIEINNPSALSKYYTLLLFIARIIASTLVSHGSQNERLLTAGAHFVRDNRALIVATFKRRAKIGGVSFDDAGIDIDELVDLFTMLIEFTGFLEDEDEDLAPQQRRTIFT